MQEFMKRKEELNRIYSEYLLKLNRKCSKCNGETREVSIKGVKCSSANGLPVVTALQCTIKAFSAN